MATKTVDQDLSDALEEIHTTCLQLEALLANTFGESGESFRNMNNELQDNYLWCCTNMASALKRSVSRAQEQELSEKRTRAAA